MLTSQKPGVENTAFTFRIGDQTIFIANKINSAWGSPDILGRMLTLPEST